MRVSVTSCFAPSAWRSGEDHTAPFLVWLPCVMSTRPTGQPAAVEAPFGPRRWARLHIVLFGGRRAEVFGGGCALSIPNIPCMEWMPTLGWFQRSMYVGSCSIGSCMHVFYTWITGCLGMAQARTPVYAAPSSERNIIPTTVCRTPWQPTVDAQDACPRGS